MSPSIGGEGITPAYLKSRQRLWEMRYCKREGIVCMYWRQVLKRFKRLIFARAWGSSVASSLRSNTDSSGPLTSLIRPNYFPGLGFLFIYGTSRVTEVQLTLGGIPSLSPLGRVSSLLSSSTLLRFSTHSGSTSPSKIIHCRLFSSPRTLSMILRGRIDVFRPTGYNQKLACNMPHYSIFPARKVNKRLKILISQPHPKSKNYTSRKVLRISPPQNAGE